MSTSTIQRCILSLDDYRAEALARFCVDIRLRPRLKAPHYCNAAVAAQCFVGPRIISAEKLLQLQRWTLRVGWHISRQRYPRRTADTRPIDIVYIAPAQTISLAAAYHATRTASIPSIMSLGLCPGTETSITTDNRTDPVGNIYVAENLGLPTDAGVAGSKTAHWWRDHLARVNRFNDPDWSILKISATLIPNAICYTDMWSESGIILGNVESVDSQFLAVAFP